MSKYSDHTTVGGQVLAHRLRMMSQNWKIIWIIGRVSFVASYLFYLMTRWKINEVWNYFAISKAFYRVDMNSLPSHFFSSSYLWANNGQWAERSDFAIARTKGFFLFKNAFEESLWFGLKLGLAVGIISMIVMLLITKYFGKNIADKKELLSGSDYVNGKSLRKLVKNKSDIKLADIPYPKDTESRHTIITGTTGSGKTNIFHELLGQVLSKNERAIIVDTVGTFVDDYFDPERDILINPLDYRSHAWNILEECGHSKILLQHLAQCLIRTKGIDSFWDEAARIVFIESIKRIIAEGRPVSYLLDLLKRPTHDWEEFLRDTCGASLMDKNADKMAISIRATLINSISCFDSLKETGKSFSIKNWISSGKGILFFSCSPAQRETIVPLITSWITIASDALMRMPKTKERTWFFIDEMHNLKRLPTIETSLAEIRKYGGCFVIGTQMISQLNEIYKEATTRTITGLCGTKIVMNIPEPETAKYMSSFLGEKEEVSTSEAISYGANTIRDGVNIAQKKEKKQTVPYSEIMNLQTGEAFLKLSGVQEIGKVQFRYHELSVNI